MKFSKIKKNKCTLEQLEKMQETLCELKESVDDWREEFEASFDMYDEQIDEVMGKLEELVDSFSEEEDDDF